MRMAVLGSGAVGQTLAKGLKTHGYDVRIASRSSDKLADFSKTTGITALPFEAAASWCEGAVLAVKGTIAEDAVRESGPDNLRGKLVIDVTNPLSDAPPEDGVLRVFTGPNESLMERLQTAFPAIHFVKAFNSVGNALMVNPQLAGGKPTMFYCGNDAGAKKIAARIIDQFGYEGEDLGTAKSARVIEPLCQLWCIPGFLTGKWQHAFKLLR
ncbi:MAG TPA: NAD(P)-binding domain-containing protein [Vicinamibacterales bacterium]|nr:NAD(P)-binding domain-containing protein [Vicinamibacterales bacterium]